MIILFCVGCHFMLLFSLHGVGKWFVSNPSRNFPLYCTFLCGLDVGLVSKLQSLAIAWFDILVLLSPLHITMKIMNNYSLLPRTLPTHIYLQERRAYCVQLQDTWKGRRWSLIKHARYFSQTYQPYISLLSPEAEIRDQDYCTSGLSIIIAVIIIITVIT